MNGSFPKVAEQVINNNKIIVDILNKLSSLTTTKEASINFDIYDENGILRTYSLPSFTSLKGEIDRLNNNINSLYNIDSNGALIQPSNQNKFKKIITIDLNSEPSQISSLGTISTFKADPNWFFDSMLNPMLNVEFDLTGKMDYNIRKCLVRRYIVNFSKDATGALTNSGQTALNSFNSTFRNNSNVDLTEFENWHKTTNGLVSPLIPLYDEQIFDLQPNELSYDGVFNVLSIQEDTLNRKIWYVIDKLEFNVLADNSIKKLSVGDELLTNTSLGSSTRYKILEVNTSQSSPRVRLERQEGLDPISVGIGTIKIYSPINYSQKLKVSIGYNERNVIFIKPINTETNIVAKKWSLGTGYWSNDLRLSSTNPDNGMTMEQFYVDNVLDYSTVLQDLVIKKTPNKLAGTPVAPTLNVDNFKVVQINKHLTDTPDSNLLKQKHNYQLTLKSEIEQIDTTLTDLNKKSKFTQFTTEADKKTFQLQIDKLNNQKVSKSKLLSSVSQEILNLSQNPITKVDPKFKLRGFWTLPDAIITTGTKPQEIIQFKVQYRYLSKDGKETPVETFNVDNTSKGAFSNWNEFKTEVRKRTFDPATNTYTWEKEDLQNAETPNINQLDLSIQNNEKIELRIKSISEVGYPESPVESDWSDIITIDFPDDLNNVINENESIVKEATKEDLKNSLNNELSAKGLDEHLSDTLTVNNKNFHHESSKILSGFKDSNGVALDLFEYLRNLEAKIKTLEEQINNVKGELKVTILRNNQEFTIKDGSELLFNIECEDYLDKYTENGVPTGRVYANNIYVIKEFVLKVENIAAKSPLGLLSSKTYLNNTDVYNNKVPQTFWVNNQDEIIYSNTTGETLTQNNNQFIWCVNYDSITDDKNSKLSENIGNLFTKNNSLTNVLSSTEYTLGYGEKTPLKFVGSNKSLLEKGKWIDETTSVASTNKLLTTIHPVIQNLEKLVETNSDKIKYLNAGESIIVPIHIYFKLNSLDSNQNGLNYKYVDFNNSSTTIKHIKKVKFLIENESENKPFKFSIKFNMNRNNVINSKFKQYDNPNIGFEFDTPTPFNG